MLFSGASFGSLGFCFWIAFLLSMAVLMFPGRICVGCVFYHGVYCACQL